MFRRLKGRCLFFRRALTLLFPLLKNQTDVLLQAEESHVEMFCYSAEINLNSILASHFLWKSAFHSNVFVLSGLTATTVTFFATLCWLSVWSHQFRASHRWNVEYFEVCTKARIRNRGVVGQMRVLTADDVHCVGSLLCRLRLLRDTTSCCRWGL